MSSTTSSKSFVRSKYDDKVGSGGITALSNNNFVASSPLWNNGAATTAGAVTCGNGASGSAGPVKCYALFAGASPRLCRLRRLHCPFD